MTLIAECCESVPFKDETQLGQMGELISELRLEVVNAGHKLALK